MDDQKKMTLVDWLDDLCVRFIINLPQEELQSVERICFQVEEAQWFYEDFIRPLDPNLPSLNLKKFCMLIFQHCPLLAGYNIEQYQQVYSEFLAYKTRVPVRGAIMLNEAMDQVVLVKGWKKGARWSFPRGKINKDENDLVCAVREVYEETGFDLEAAGLVKPESEMKHIEVSMREQHMRLYVFRGVPMDTHFEPRTRKEISAIAWYKLSDLPTLKKRGQQGNNDLKDNMFYMVAPFLGALKHWIKQQRKLDRIEASQGLTAQHVTDVEAETADTADDGAAGSLGKGVPSDDHLNRLLDNLRQSAAPEIAAQPEPAADPALELKRLLSVSGSMPGSAQPSQPNPLLSMLQGNSAPSMRYHGNVARPLMTPLEKITTNAPEPHSPHPHHPHQPRFTGMPPPPPFPLSNAPQPPSSQQTPIPPQPPVHRQFPQQSAFNQQQTQFPPNQNQPHQWKGPQGHAVPPTAPAQMRAQQQFQRPPQYQGPQPSHQHITRLFNPPSDQYGHAPGFSAGQGPVIPPASQLPAPRLNPHARNLLNSFRAPKPPLSNSHAENQAKAQAQAHKVADIYKSVRGDKPDQAQPSSDLEAVISPMERLLRPSSLGNVHPPQPPLMNGSFQSVETAQPQPRSAHQDNLLSLLRSPSAAVATPVSQTQQAESSTMPTEPVELSANPSPQVTKPQSQFGKGLYPSNLAPATVRTKSSQQKPGQTTATVSGPLNAPDLDVLQRGSQAHRKPVELPGQPISAARDENVQSGPRPNPITILARPKPPTGTPSPTNTTTPPVSATLRRFPAPPKAGSPARQSPRGTQSPRGFQSPRGTQSPRRNQSPRDYQSKTFNPQILRRGQQLPQVEPVTASPQQQQQPAPSEPDTRRDSLSTAQSALLGLFKPPMTTNTGTAARGLGAGIQPPLTSTMGPLPSSSRPGSSGVMSPVSPLPMGLEKRAGSPPSVSLSGGKSRVGSVGSIVGGGAGTGAGAGAGPAGLGAGMERKPSAVNTPEERQFLLGLLRDLK